MDEESQQPSAFMFGRCWPELKQSSAMGEYVAFGVLAECADVGTRCFVDYKHLARLHALQEEGIRPSFVAAGVWREALCSEAFANVDSVTWVKAHQQLEESMSAPEAAHVVGNRWADCCAKRGAMMHEGVSQVHKCDNDDCEHAQALVAEPDEWLQAELVTTQFLSFAKLAARSLAVWLLLCKSL